MYNRRRVGEVLPYTRICVICSLRGNNDYLNTLVYEFVVLLFMVYISSVKKDLYNVVLILCFVSN